MFCKKCGAELKEGSVLCNICGEPVNHRTEGSRNLNNRNLKSTKKRDGIASFILILILGVIVCLILNSNNKKVEYDSKKEENNSKAEESLEPKQLSSANFADFTSDVDNVHMDVINQYTNLYTKHSIEGKNITMEQIYFEIATGKAGASSHMDGNCVNIDAKNNKLSRTVPKVNGSNEGWYITKKGDIFNITGCKYDGKIYFSSLHYTTDDVSAYSRDKLAEKIADTIMNSEETYEIKLSK